MTDLLAGPPAPGPAPDPAPAAPPSRVLAGLVDRVRWRPTLLLLLVAVPAVVLRTWHLDTLGVNSDEAVYAGQAAALAQDPQLAPYFPLFRAHPLLFQTLLSLPYHLWGVSSLAGRLLAVAFGLGTVWLVHLTATLLYSRRVGVVAALLAAVMPYLVVVNRQILLDGPMAFFATLSLYLLARFALTERPAWLYAASASLGLTFLTKETSILLMGGVYAFLALTASVRVRVRTLALATLLYAAVISVYPLAVVLSGAKSTGGSFLVYQLLRRPNHGWLFYPSVLPEALGIPVVVAALLGLWLLRRHTTWRESLLVWWVVGPAVFFEIWAVKGYQYLLPLAAPAAVLAARALCAVPDRVLTVRGRALPARLPSLALTALTALWLAATSWSAVSPAAAGTDFLAGTGGVPGGREAGRWIEQNVPEGSKMLALGPSMANIVQFYGHRETFGLSVSPNPLHRNPVYEPVDNPDLRIRRNDLQYVVWDSFSAARSPFFAKNLLRYTERYHGRVVHTESVEGRGPDGRRTLLPVVVVYQVRP